MKTMKTQRAVLPLAFLSAAFMLGCQDQGLEPVGPEGLAPLFHAGHDDDCMTHNKNDPGCNGGGGDGGSTLAAVVLTDGMEADLSRLVVERDNDKNLIIGNFDPDHAITMNFTDLGDCTAVSIVPPTDDQFTDLVAELTDPFNPATFRMAIVRSSLGEPGKHRLTVGREGTFDDPNTGVTRIQLGGPHGGPVTVVENPPGSGVFTFTGPVVVWAHGVDGGGGRKSNRIIQCAGTVLEPNKVTATVNLTP